jgi:hypothetical protein
LKLESPVALDNPRTIASTQAVIGPWFDLLTHTLLLYKIIPALFFNCDETALFINEIKPPKAITHVESTVLPLSTTAERMPTATVVFTICADGTHLPSIILWPRQTLPPELSAPVDDIVFVANGSGWETKASFFLIMTTYIVPAMERKRNLLGYPQAVILLVLDSHSYRCSAELLSYCISKKVLLLTIPPHTSHLIQPADRGPNATMKQALPIQLAHFAKLLDDAYLHDLRMTLRSNLGLSPHTSTSSAPVSSFSVPFTPPPSPAYPAPAPGSGDEPADRPFPRPLSKVGRERRMLFFALPHVFARALAEAVVQHAFEVSGLWPLNKSAICSQLPPTYAGRLPPATTRTSLLPSLGGTIINTPAMVDKIRSWEQSRAPHPPKPPLPDVPTVHHTILYDDDDSDASDMDPIPLEELEADASGNVMATAPAMEKEPNTSDEENELGDPGGDLPDPMDEGEELQAADVEFCSGDEDLLP